MGIQRRAFHPYAANRGKLGFGAIPTLGYLEALNPPVTSGKGVLLRNVDGAGGTTWNVASTDVLSLINLQFKQQSSSPAAGQFWGIRIITDSDVVDTAAAIGIQNIGHSDSLYINLSGRSGAEALNKPTGIGLDANRGASTGNPGAPVPVVAYENSPTFQGRPIQVWDFSQTDNAIGGLLYLRKLNNANTTTTLLRLEGNRNSIDIAQDEANSNTQLTGGGATITTAYDPLAPQIQIFNGSSQIRYRLHSSGEVRQAGAMYVYNSTIENVNFERAGLKYNSSSNRFELVTDKGASGVSRELAIGTNVSGVGIRFLVNASTQWLMNSSGHLVTGTDNAVDIGASGATRPRDAYLAGNVTIAGKHNHSGQTGNTVANNVANQGIGTVALPALTSGATGTVTITDSRITASSLIWITVKRGTTTPAAGALAGIVADLQAPGSGSCVVDLRNAGTAATLSTDYVLHYLVVN
jgi:hypothetical protein